MPARRRRYTVAAAIGATPQSIASVTMWRIGPDAPRSKAKWVPEITANCGVPRACAAVNSEWPRRSGGQRKGRRPAEQQTGADDQHPGEHAQREQGGAPSYVVISQRPSGAIVVEPRPIRPRRALRPGCDAPRTSASPRRYGGKLPAATPTRRRRRGMFDRSHHGSPRRGPRRAGHRPAMTTKRTPTDRTPPPKNIEATPCTGKSSSRRSKSPRATSPSPAAIGCRKRRATARAEPDTGDHDPAPTITQP